MSGVFPNANPLGYQQPGARTMPMPMQQPQGGPVSYTNPTGTAPMTPAPQPAPRTTPEPMTPPPQGLRPAGMGQLPANNPLGAWQAQFPHPNFTPQMPRSFGPMGQAGGK